MYESVCFNNGNNSFRVNIIGNDSRMTKWKYDTSDDLNVIHNICNKPYDTVANFEIFRDEFK